jgi:FkbM family methyltransferase
MDDAFEAVVAENRLLRKELKTLRARVTALESSRWWQLHPRRLLRRGTPSFDGNGAEAFSSRAKVKRVAQSWRLKAEYERRSAASAADEIAIREGLRLKVHPSARWSFEMFCFSAPEQVEELDAFIANTSERKRLLDVGAHDGIFSLVFAAGRPDKRALAVDASPLSFPTLLYNVHRNGADNITAVECALSNEASTLEMHFEGEFAVAGANSGASAVQIETETGDRLCARYSFEPDAVKIDAEGHELRVIQGLRATIVQRRPLIFLEVHPAMIAADGSNGTVAELVEELRALGYREAEIRGDVRPVEAINDLIHIERLLLRPA